MGTLLLFIITYQNLQDIIKVMVDDRPNYKYSDVGSFDSSVLRCPFAVAMSCSLAFISVLLSLDPKTKRNQKHLLSRISKKNNGPIKKTMDRVLFQSHMFF